MLITRDLLTLITIYSIGSDHFTTRLITITIKVIILNNCLLTWSTVLNRDRNILISWLYLGSFYYTGVRFIPWKFRWINILKNLTYWIPRTISGLLSYEIYYSLTGKFKHLYVIRHRCWRADILDGLLNFFNEVRVIISPSCRVVLPRNVSLCFVF